MPRMLGCRARMVTMASYLSSLARNACIQSLVALVGFSLAKCICTPSLDSYLLSVSCLALASSFVATGAVVAAATVATLAASRLLAAVSWLPCFSCPVCSHQSPGIQAPWTHPALSSLPASRLFASTLFASSRGQVVPLHPVCIQSARIQSHCVLSVGIERHPV